jgi:predicted TIM-barrel enzyme/DNA-binding NtrC family response regulator
MMSAGQPIVPDRLFEPRHRVPGRRRPFLVGAAIGTGMAAQAATRGGADFLLALNAGRLRSMGEPSVASLLAVRDTNRFVMEFAKAEIRPRTTLPVFIGLAALDPHLETTTVLDAIRDAGFEGVSNFPTVALIDGRFRRFLESTGFGFEREVALLAAARERGLATLGYSHTREEARRMAAAGVDIVNIDLGWNTGGALGVASRMQIEEAAELATQIVRAIRKISEHTVCVVEGGPIVRPEQMDHVCRAAQADGYIGGSTIDRVPLESAIELVTGAFKTMGALGRQVTRLEQQLDGKRGPLALTGSGSAMDRARAAFDQAVATELPVLVLGEAGTGRRDLARVIHAAGARKGHKLVWLSCADSAGERLDADLFGCEAGALPGLTRKRIGWLEIARGSTLVLDDIGEMPSATQQRLSAALESGSFWRLGGNDHLPLDVRLVGISRFDPTQPVTGGFFDPHLLDVLSAIRIELPPLRDHLEDLPHIIQHLLDAMTTAVGKPSTAIDPSALHVLLAHDWPGNAKELGTALQRALLAAGEGPIMAAHLPAFRPPSRRRDGRSGFASEREWILDGLRRNRFRRGEAARFLGVSRKTLYNKMAALGILAPNGPMGTPRRR